MFIHYRTAFQAVSEVIFSETRRPTFAILRIQTYTNVT